jgi:hypothetical protein
MAEKYGISERQVRRAVKRGELPSARLGKFLYVDPTPIEAQLARVKQE